MPGWKGILAHPLTTHACPGKGVRRFELIQQVQDLIVARHAGEHPASPAA